MVLGEADGTLHVAQDLGHFGVKMKRSRDGGSSWEDRPVPKYPPKPEGEEDIDPTRRTPVPWDLKKVWALETSAREGELWCGTIPGALFRSRDGGDSWQIVDSLWNHPKRKEWFGGGADYPGIHSVLVDPRDPDVVKVGVSCGGLWASADAGASWELQGVGMRSAFMPPDQALNPGIQDPHRIVQCTAAPEHVWIQHHNGIFRSTDGAVVVSRTRDGAASFDVLRSGLPQQHAYDLVYRHGLDIDADGATLAFGSTTGNLWLSEDQGDHWQQLSSSLPPIYCVRFAA
jgi:hypothetical protein